MKVIHREQTDAQKAASKRGKTANAKGKGYEREKVSQAKERGLFAKREYQFDGGKHRSDMGIYHDPDFREKWFHCEAKKWKHPPSVKAVMKQAMKDAGPGVVPVAIICKDAEPVKGFRPKGSTFREEKVSMLIEDWFKLACWVNGKNHPDPVLPEGVYTAYVTMDLDAWLDLIGKVKP